MSQKFADIEGEPQVWLWPDRIPKGKLVTFCGNPGIGKTTVVCDIIARLTTGRDYPDSRKNAEAGDVLFMSSEDGAADVLKPRLQAAGADTNRVHLLKGIKGKNSEQRQLALDTDLKALAKHLRDNPQIKLVVIDPIAGYLGRADMNKEQELRRVLEPIARLANDTGITFIALSHFSKRNDVTALHKVGGAVGMSGVARAVWMFAKDPETPDQYLMLCGKLNVSKNHSGLKYRIGSKMLDGLGEQPVIAWQGVAEQDADSTFDVISDPREKASMRAQRFLTDYMREPRLSEDIFAEGKRRGLSNRKALWEAKKELSIKAEQKGGHWWWYPAEKTASAYQSNAEVRHYGYAETLTL